MTLGHVDWQILHPFSTWSKNSFYYLTQKPNNFNECYQTNPLTKSKDSTYCWEKWNPCLSWLATKLHDWCSVKIDMEHGNVPLIGIIGSGLLWKDEIVSIVKKDFTISHAITIISHECFINLLRLLWLDSTVSKIFSFRPSNSCFTKWPQILGSGNLVSSKLQSLLTPKFASSQVLNM